jgi:hypothetical protein
LAALKDVTLAVNWVAKMAEGKAVYLVETTVDYLVENLADNLVDCSVDSLAEQLVAMTVVNSAVKKVGHLESSMAD